MRPAETLARGNIIKSKVNTKKAMRTWMAYCMKAIVLPT